jgi:hypothetical protein
MNRSESSNSIIIKIIFYPILIILWLNFELLKPFSKNQMVDTKIFHLEDVMDKNNN